VHPHGTERLPSSHLRETATARFEVRSPDGAAPLPTDTQGAAAPKREAPFVPPRVGMARRRRPTPCGEAGPISEKRRLRGLKSGAPTARRPYQLTRRVLPHHGAKRPRSPRVGMARRRRPTPCGGLPSRSREAHRLEPPPSPRNGDCAV
jgi:hypothetical protein